jgi:hypothetical protein
MELLDYLGAHFLSKNALLSAANISEQQLRSYQQQGVMPLCSYKLRLDLQCDSFFGLYKEQQEREYYAREYVAWLATINTLKSSELIYAEFARRYKEGLCELQGKGHVSNSPKLNRELEQHIAEEWLHFLKGTYGLCTRSGLPEDIAAKELAILEIREITAIENLNQGQLIKLGNAVKLLDSASSSFAPHERPESSRHRLIDEMRRKYKLD